MASSSGFDQHSESGQQLIRELAEASGDAMRRVALASPPDESSTVFAKKMLAAAMRASAVAYCDNITRREEEEKAKVTTPAVMSPELQKMIDEMNKTTVQHNYVYPPEPSEGAVLIPTGGLAKCQCSPDCPETLMQPAYRVIEGEERKKWIPDEKKPVVVVKEVIGKKIKKRRIVRC